MQGLSREAVRRVYRFYAPVYDFVFGLLLDSGRAALARAIDPAARRVLEVGVGTGLALKRYPAKAQVVGVDLSEEMLMRAMPRAERLRGARAVDLVCADAEHLPFPDDSFDAITLPYVLSVTPNPQALLRELRRVCRPGGQILILNHFRGAQGMGLLERMLGRFAHRVGFDSQLDMDSTLGTQDWTREQVQPVNLFGLSRLVLLRNG